MPRIITLTPNPTYDFACEADVVEPNRKLRCYNPKTHPGGGGINVARAAMRLGADVLCLFTAGGLYGEALKQAVEEEKVPARVIPVSGTTRLAFHVREESKEQEYRFNLPGAEISTQEVDNILAAVSEEASEGDYVVGSGSMPPGAGEDFWARASRAAKNSGARFVLDSIHGRHAAMDEGIYMLRQNMHEYVTLTDDDLTWPDDVHAFASKIVRSGKVDRMVITHGADGSVMATRNGRVTAPALEVKAHSAVGAGDSFVGGLLVALLRGDDDEHALRYASAAAAATRMSSGTSLFKAADVDRLFREG